MALIWQERLHFNSGMMLPGVDFLEEVASGATPELMVIIIDHQTGEVFFGLKGAGIIWMSNDLKQKRCWLVTEPMILEGNYNTTISTEATANDFCLA